MFPLLVLTMLAATDAGTPDSATRLKLEAAALRDALVKKCPDQKDTVGKLEGAKGAERAALLTQLAPCGAGNEQYFVLLGNAHNQAGHPSDAEAAYRAALKLKTTDAAQVGLAIALVLQKDRSDTQKKDLADLFAAFKRVPCRRDDLCAGLSYAAWNANDEALAKDAAERAIAMQFPGWQPYFVAGTVYATGLVAERMHAIGLLREARRRGGPAKAIDDLLVILTPDGGH